LEEQVMKVSIYYTYRGLFEDQIDLTVVT